jgi:hypothetical protein
MASIKTHAATYDATAVMLCGKPIIKINFEKF